MEENKKPEEKHISIGESVFSFLREVFNLHDQVDKERTREEVLDNINFKGLSAFVLIASVFIASIGLNSNSVAVVIGAMLISPLMGPIMGLGYAVAVNDIKTLNRSFTNFGIMVVIAMLTSFIYFSIAPLTTLTEQLKGRIEPTSLDVLIGIFGGLAGIAAFSSKIKNSNVIAGVAIATALMPPLCTVGYGLSMGTEQIGYKDYSGYGAALNAFYLFIINSIFIGISTYVYIKLNKFPLAQYQNATQARKTNFIIAGVAVLTIIPSGFIFYGIIKEELYKVQVNNFLNHEIAIPYENAFFNLNNPTLTKKDSVNLITISTITEVIPQEVIKNWNIILREKYNLKNTKLIVHQGGMPMANNQINERIYSSIYSTVKGDIQKRDSIIEYQQKQINRLNSDTIPFQSISKELKSLYPELDYFGYATFNYTDFKNRNIMPTFILLWNDNKTHSDEERRINQFLKSRLSLDTIQLLHK
ncbi:DUF389 domain-containing protein [Weeksellaceae bacterium TAE3-ERU29]|nr:DUF389 domain-containing protein [Weeksellaceae bacterium TAE3-ERU29]